MEVSGEVREGTCWRRYRPAPRGSAKSVQVVGRVSSLLARLGRRGRDLVVEAMETPGPRKRRMRLMARFLRAAMISGPLRVLSW